MVLEREHAGIVRRNCAASRAIRAGELRRARSETAQSTAIHCRLRIDSKNAESYATRSCVYAEQRDFAKAESDSAKAVALARNFPYSSFCRGYVLWKKGERAAVDKAFVATVSAEAVQKHELELNGLRARLDEVDTLAMAYLDLYELSDADFRKKLHITAAHEMKLRSVLAEFEDRNLDADQLSGTRRSRPRTRLMRCPRADPVSNTRRPGLESVSVCRHFYTLTSELQDEQKIVVVAIAHAKRHPRLAEIGYSHAHRRRLPRGPLAVVLVEHDLPQADLRGRDLDQLVLLDELQRLLQRQPPRGTQQDVAVVAAGPHVAELLLLRRIDVHVLVAAVLADDHALVDHVVVADVQFGPLLQACRGRRPRPGRRRAKPARPWAACRSRLPSACSTRSGDGSRPCPAWR